MPASPGTQLRDPILVHGILYMVYMDAVAKIGRRESSVCINKNQTQIRPGCGERMDGLTQDRTAELVSQDQIVWRE